VLETRDQPLLLQRCAQRDGDEVLEQLVHVEQETVHGERIRPRRSVLRRGAAQNGFAEPQGRLVSRVEAGGLPARQLLSPDQWERAGETDPLVRQSPPHGAGNAREPQQSLDGGPQDAVLGGVRGVASYAISTGGVRPKCRRICSASRIRPRTTSEVSSTSR